MPCSLPGTSVTCSRRKRLSQNAAVPRCMESGRQFPHTWAGLLARRQHLNLAEEGCLDGGEN